MSDPSSPKDPLAALENALRDSKGSAGKPAPGKAAAEAAAKADQQRRELESLEAQHQKQDAAALETQLQSIRAIAQEKTAQQPAEPASKPAESSESPADDQSGYEIRQMDHTKIPKDA